jgi:hypothetical protein
VEENVPVAIGPQPRYAFRDPYTITTRMRQTNWLEISLTWPNKWFGGHTGKF